MSLQAVSTSDQSQFEQRVPPSDVISEQSTLGGMLLSTEAVAEAMEQSRNMPDPADRASGIEILERISGVAAVREKLHGQGAEECEECGIEIPEARRRAAPWAVCCVDCQGLREGRRHG